MKKIKLSAIITLCFVLLFNLANASTIITRNTSYGGASGIYNVKFGTETKPFANDLQAQTYTANIALRPGVGTPFNITVTLEGVSVTHTFYIYTSTASGSVLTTFTTSEFDFPTYGYGVVVYYNNTGALNYTVTKYSKP